MTRTTANCLLLFAALLWGTGIAAQSTAMDALGPWTFTGLRFLIAAAVFAPFAWLEARRHARSTEGRRAAARARRAGDVRLAGLSPLQLALFGGVGLVFFGANLTQQVGLVSTSVTNTGFLTGLYVVLVPLFGLALFREQPGPFTWPAAVLTLCGVWLLGEGRLDTFNWGDCAVLACAVFWALHVLLLGRTGAESGRPMALCVVQFVVVAVLGLGGGLAIMGETLSAEAVGNAWFELFYTGVIDGGVAFGIQAVAQRWTRSSDAAVLLSSEALFAALAGTLFLGETLSLTAASGCGVILAAILLVQRTSGEDGLLEPVRAGSR